MALRAGYYGVKRDDAEKLKKLPGISEIGTGLELDEDGELSATGTTKTIEGNPEGSATETLTKLQIGEEIFSIPGNDNTKCYQTDDSTESAIVDGDYIPFLDSSAASGAGAPRKSTWSNFITKIKAKITEFVTWSAQSILGAVNLLPVVDYSGTTNGIVYNVSDGVITAVSGESTANTGLIIGDFTFKAGVIYYLSGFPTTGSADTWLGVYDSGTSSYEYMQGPDHGAVTEIQYNADTVRSIRLRIQSGTSVDNLVIKPMITVSPNAAFTPHVMTNRELMERIQKGTITYTSTANTYVKVGSVDIPSGYSLIVAASNFNSACTGLLITSKDGTAVFGSDVAEAPADFTTARKSCSYVNVGANVATVDIHAKNSGSNSETVKYVIVG